MEIKIRALELSDFADIQEIYSQEKAYSGTLQLPMPSQEMWKEKIRSRDSNEHVLVAEVEGKVVGTLMCSCQQNPRRKHVGRIGMGVHDQWQGKGIGTALMERCVDLAENWLNLSRLELSVFTDNEAAVKLYQKFDFEVEGTAKKYALQNGVFKDTYTMARIS